MKAKSYPRDLTEATESVHWFLRLCFLSRVKSLNGGGYTLKNIFLGSLVFGVTLLATDVYCLVFGRFNNYPGFIFGIIEVCHTACSAIDLAITLYKANSDNEMKTRKEIDNLSTIDEAFGVHCADTYKRDRLTMNTIFFVLLALRTTIATCIAISYTFTLGMIWLPFLTQMLIQFLLDANYIFNISKLKLINYRMVVIQKYIYKFREGNKMYSAESIFPNGIDHHRLQYCHLKMYEICLLFNESQGLQILFAYARLIITTITTITAVSQEKYKPNMTMIVGNFTFLTIDVGMLVALLIQATSILQTSRDISLVVERALANKRFGSERESAAWEEFVELVHRCPLVLTAYDFFTLDYSLLGATFGTMVTYTIILTQLAH